MRAIVLLLFAAGNVLAQAPTPSAPKDAGVATLLGFVIPGGGQYYAEETEKGVALTFGAALGIVYGVTRSHGDIYRKEFDFTNFTSRDVLSERANYAPLKVGGMIAGAFWLYGILEAPSAARRANAKRARVSLIQSPTQLGLSVAF